MRTAIRRVGNSLGVILPRPLLESWGVGEGDLLEVDEHGRLGPRPGNRQLVLDDLKLLIAMEVVSRFTPDEIRRRSRRNLQRWRKRGTWVGAYDEWKTVLNGDDQVLIRTMIGRDERANRLRQSIPFVGMLPADVLERLREKVAG